MICKHCGKVQEKRIDDPKFTPKHAFSCNAVDPSDEDNFIESLYLYREFNSEAIRLLLPVTTLEISTQKLHSLIAAFQMGLKSYFKGSVDHLHVSTYDETERDDQLPKRFLVLYDSIPGGTGYLRQLMRDSKPLFEVLQQAYDKLVTCGCNDDHTKDGCYKCLYAYKNNFDRPLISRERAKEVIKAILASQKSVKKIETVGNINTDGHSESELEKLFLAKLETLHYEGLKSQLKPIITSRHRAGFLFEIGDLSYELEQQIDFGINDDIAVACRADFVFYPLGQSKLKPVVVFTDGFAYHKNRVDVDSAQRLALVASCNYHVWSLTWEDVYLLGQNKPQYQFVNYLQAPFVKMELLEKMLPNQERQFAQKTNFEWLLDLLANANTDVWQKRANYTALAMIERQIVKADTEEYKKIEALCTSELIDSFSDTSNLFLTSTKLDEDIQLAILAPQDMIAKQDYSTLFALVHLDEQSAETSMNRWAGALRIFNLFQFMKYGCFTTRSGIEQHLYDGITRSEDTHKEADDWSFIYEEVLDEAKALVKLLAQENAPLPEVGYEYVNDNGVVEAEFEMAWPVMKIGVVIDKAIILEGWEVFTTEQVNDIVARVKEKSSI